MALEQVQTAINELAKVLLGKQQALHLAVCCLLSRGHVLFEDLPGVGKTTLAHALARVFGLEYKRTQFTADLLPSDLIGGMVFSREREEFFFQPGSVFTQLVLADEVNRASPKTQSALLEAMAERQVSVDGVTHQLPTPFFVIATQNPLEQLGVYPLPESQLDRFAMRISLGYPDFAAERALLSGKQVSYRDINAVMQVEELVSAQNQVAAIACSDALLDYVQALLLASREHPALQFGLSPRAGLVLVNAARANAFLQGRNYAVPEDVQVVFVAVAAHRFVTTTRDSGDAIASFILKHTPVP